MIDLSGEDLVCGQRNLSVWAAPVAVPWLPAWRAVVPWLTPGQPWRV